MCQIAFSIAFIPRLIDHSTQLILKTRQMFGLILFAVLNSLIARRACAPAPPDLTKQVGEHQTSAVVFDKRTYALDRAFRLWNAWQHLPNVDKPLLDFECYIHASRLGLFREARAVR